MGLVYGALKVLFLIPSSVVLLATDKQCIIE